MKKIAIIGAGDGLPLPVAGSGASWIAACRCPVLTTTWPTQASPFASRLVTMMDFTGCSSFGGRCGRQLGGVFGGLGAGRSGVRRDVGVCS